MPTTLKLTSGQQRVMDAIAHLLNQLGYSPSIAEIAEQCECSRPHVCRVLAILEQKGCVRRGSNRTRSISV